MLSNNAAAEDVIKALTTSMSPFEGLESQYSQKKYFQQNLGLVVSTFANTTVKYVTIHTYRCLRDGILVMIQMTSATMFRSSNRYMHS